MNIYTYYHDCAEIDAEEHLRLINLWRHHHEKMGFDPVVLTQYHARLHPYFAEFDRKVRRLPTTNPDGYDLACYHRWLAMAWLLENTGDSWAMMADYDMFIRDPLLPPFIPDHDRLRVHENIVPCLVTGTAKAFLTACTWFAEFPIPDDTKHLSDMYILEALAMAKPDLFDRAHLVKSYGDTDWQKAPAIHFSTFSMQAKLPKWKTIPKILAELS